MMNYTMTDSKGAYIVIPENEDDLVVLRKNVHGKYEYVIRGDAIDKLAKQEAKMRVYISGKITGTTDYEERFLEAEKNLKEKGYVPVNPVKMSRALLDMVPDASYDNFMEMDFALLCICDGIYMIDGWEDSNGAKREYERAKLMGKEIVEF